MSLFFKKTVDVLPRYDETIPIMKEDNFKKIPINWNNYNIQNNYEKSGVNELITYIVDYIEKIVVEEGYFPSYFQFYCCDSKQDINADEQNFIHFNYNSDPRKTNTLSKIMCDKNLESLFKKNLTKQFNIHGAELSSSIYINKKKKYIEVIFKTTE